MERAELLQDIKKDGGNGKESNNMEPSNHTPRNSQFINIEMKVNSYVFIFGIPLMLTAIILGSIVIARLLTPSLPQVNVEAPHIIARLDVPPPIVNIKPSDVPIRVDVPQQSTPYINVQLPRSEPPNVSVTLPEGKKGDVQIVEKIVEKIKEVQIPIYVDTADKATITFNDIYPVAEDYINKWCVKNGKDQKAESKRWSDLWLARVTERGDEQAIANEALIEKRDGFKVDIARSQDVVEICRLMLRYRDAKLSIPTLFKEYVTASSLYKLKLALEKGPQ